MSAVSDNNSPSDDIVSTLGGKAEAILRDALDRMEDALQNEGRRTVRIQCSTCGKGNTASVEVVDAEQLRKFADTVASITFRAAAAKKDLSDSDAAVKLLLRDRSELSDAELAEYIVTLETELAAETTSVDRELAATIESLNQEQRVALLEQVRKVKP